LHNHTHYKIIEELDSILQHLVKHQQYLLLYFAANILKQKIIYL